MKVITFKIDEDLLVKLDYYAIKYKLNRSEAIRKAIEEMVKKDMEKEITPALKVEQVKI